MTFGRRWERRGEGGPNQDTFHGRTMNTLLVLILAGIRGFYFRNLGAKLFSEGIDFRKNRKKKTFYFRILLLFYTFYAENHQLVTKANYRNRIEYHRHSQRHMLMLNVLCNCIIHIYIVAMN